MIPKQLKVGVIPIAHRLDRRVSQWLLSKGVKAGMVPAHPTGIVSQARGQARSGLETWVLPGLTGKTRSGLWFSCRSPLSTARAGGGGLPGGGLGLGWLQASPSAGDTICSCRGYLIAPALMLGGRDREIRGYLHLFKDTMVIKAVQGRPFQAVLAGLAWRS